MEKSIIISVLESVKKDEYRIPCHPKHFPYLSKSNNRLFFQSEYGKRFSQSDAFIKQQGFEVASRDQLLQDSDVVFLLKPEVEDLSKMREGAILVGWCHTIQRVDIAAMAVKKGLTLIAMESMYQNIGSKREHLFLENNFSAGFLGIEHALLSTPYHYPQDAKVSVITYGAVSQGAVSKLVEKGFSNITVFSRRPVYCIDNKFSSVSYKKVEAKVDRFLTSSGQNLRDTLLESDISINGIMQDVLNPMYFLSSNDLLSVKHKLIVDLSCDDHMGFDFSTPTSLNKPVIMLGNNNYYYAVDNVPSLAWDENSLVISEKLLPFINSFLENRWDADLKIILEAATDIKGGTIKNNVITEYQKKLATSNLFKK